MQATTKRALLFNAMLWVAMAAFGQQTILIPSGDKVRLEADEWRGEIQWQQSFDNSDWEALPGATSGSCEVTVTTFPIYFRAMIVEENCVPHFSEVITVLLLGDEIKLWSDPDTWNGNKPQAGESVTIPAGEHIYLDESPPALAGLTIEGTLEFMPMDLSLSCHWIVVHGALIIGTEEAPFQHKATLTLTDTNTDANIMEMGTRGIMVMGGTLELHGAVPNTIKTKISQHAEVGTTSIQLTDAVNWKIGDEIVIGPTDYFAAGNGASVSQKLTITAVEGSQISFAEPLNAFRWGLLQYATADGMSLSSENLLAAPVPDTEEKKTPLVLDERAPVGHLSRNIVIQAPDDDRWNDLGFGVHVMIMGPSSTAHVDGIEIRRAGQRGRLARYGFHWHQLSYSGTSTLGDATGQYFRNSVIHGSQNRGIVVHGTNGVVVKDNIVFDVRGHGIFTEDAVERRNVFDGNLVLRVRNSTQPLKQHETGERGSAGFWISNPDNVIINNTAADCRSSGFWLAYPLQPWGINNSVLDTRDGLLLQPNRQEFGVFDNNTAHSNGLEGIMLDEVEIDNAGNTFPFQYASTTTGRASPWPFTAQRRFRLTNYNVWKNLDNGIWDRAVWPDNYGVVSADNCGRFFAGSGADGVIEHSLVVGTSLNHMMNGTGRPAGADYAAGHSSSHPAAFATYHSSFDIRNNIIINFPALDNTRSGVFATDDYYERPVDKGHLRNANNLILNSHPGIKLAPPAPYTWFVLAGALLDAQGLWGPAGNYFVYDLPFFTYGKTISEVAPSAEVAGGVSVPGPYYGFAGFVLHGVGDVPPQNQPYFALMGIHVRRFDDALNPVGEWVVPPPPGPTSLLPNKRHFAAANNGIYELTFPQETNHPTNFQMDVENMLETTDQLVMSIQFSGDVNASVRMFVYNGRVENYTMANSREELIASNGAMYWQDKDNDRVWVKLRGGYWQFWTTDQTLDTPSSDELLYETTVLQIRPDG